MQFQYVADPNCYNQTYPPTTSIYYRLYYYPMQPRPYLTTNSYTHRPSKQQVLTILIFLCLLALHCIFMVRPIIQIDHPLLYCLWALYWLLIAGVVVEYMIVTCSDPVDELIKNPDDVGKFILKGQEYYRERGQEFKAVIDDLMQEQDDNPYRLRMCKQCGCVVRWKSYHCWSCRRCVQDMDHHCKYLNNCVAADNYTSFFALLLFFSLLLLLQIGTAVWIFVACFYNPEVESKTFSKWMMVVVMVLGLGCLALVQSLMCFHIYISCYSELTTVDYLNGYRPRQRRKGISQSAMQLEKE